MHGASAQCSIQIERQVTRLKPAILVSQPQDENIYQTILKTG